MPIVVDRDEKRRLISATATGQASVDELFAFLKAHWVTAAADYAIFVDARTMIIDQTASDVRALASRLEQYGGSLHAPLAIVVAPDIAANHAFGMARMFEMLLEAAGISRVRVFRSMAHAESWLGIKLR
jgi:hypothetical protein